MIADGGSFSFHLIYKLCSVAQCDVRPTRLRGSEGLDRPAEAVFTYSPEIKECSGHPLQISTPTLQEERMKHRYAIYLRCVLILAFLFTSNGFAGQQKLTNQDVIKMVKAGLSPEIVIQTIKAGERNFDLSADGLVVLKGEGVPEAVIQAMLAPPENTGSRPSQPSLNDLNDANSARGATLIDGANKIRMKYSASDMRTSGMFSGPFSAKVRSALRGNHAQLRIANGSPEFEVALPADADPADVVAIVKFDVKSDRREVQISKMNLTGAKSGIPKDRQLPIQIEEAQNQGRRSSDYYKLFRIKLVNPLPPGEYGLVTHGTTFYDFGIDVSK